MKHGLAGVFLLNYSSHDWGKCFLISVKTGQDITKPLNKSCVHLVQKPLLLLLLFLNACEHFFSCLIDTWKKKRFLLEKYVICNLKFRKYKMTSLGLLHV